MAIPYIFNSMKWQQILYSLLYFCNTFYAQTGAICWFSLKKKKLRGKNICIAANYAREKREKKLVVYKLSAGDFNS